MRFSLEPEECYCSLLHFYTAVATKCQEITDMTGFDSRKISVTKPVAESLIRYLKDNGIYGGDIGMVMACYGPKAELDGDDYAAEIDDGFIVPPLTEE